MVVSEVMTRDPLIVNVTESVSAAMDLLFSADVRHLPVVEGGQLVGILSDRDVRSLTLPTAWNEQAVDEAKANAAEPVSNYMSGGVISVYPDSELSEVLDLMVEYKIGAVPVVDPHTSAVVGIVSYVDLLRALRGLVD